MELPELGLERWGERSNTPAGACQAAGLRGSRTFQSPVKASRPTHTFDGCRGGPPCQEETRVAFEQCKYWWKAPTNSQGQEGSYTSQYILYVILFMSFVQVLRRLLNLGSAGAELWAHYQAVETCRHRLSTEVNINSNQHDCMVG